MSHENYYHVIADSVDQCEQIVSTNQSRSLRDDQKMCSINYMMHRSAIDEGDTCQDPLPDGIGIKQQYVL